MESLNLDSNNDRPTPPSKPPTPWLLISTTVLGTLLVFVLGLWMFGIISVGAGSNIDTGPDDVATAETPQKRIKGNRRTRIYHLPRCSSYNRIAEHNIRWFNTRENAADAGYKLAGNC